MPPVGHATPRYRAPPSGLELDGARHVRREERVVLLRDVRRAVHLAQEERREVLHRRVRVRARARGLLRAQRQRRHLDHAVERRRLRLHPHLLRWRVLRVDAQLALLEHLEAHRRRGHVEHGAHQPVLNAQLHRRHLRSRVGVGAEQLVLPRRAPPQRARRQQQARVSKVVHVLAQLRRDVHRLPRVVVGGGVKRVAPDGREHADLANVEVRGVQQLLLLLRLKIGHLGLGLGVQHLVILVLVLVVVFGDGGRGRSVEELGDGHELDDRVELLRDGAVAARRAVDDEVHLLAELAQDRQVQIDGLCDCGAARLALPAHGQQQLDELLDALAPTSAG